MMRTDPFQSPKYEIRRKFFSLGRSCDIYDLKEELVFRAKMRPFRKDIYLQFVGAESPEAEALFLEAKGIGFNTLYDVMDPVTGGLLGTLSRKGLNAFLKNEWTLIGLDGGEDTAQNVVIKQLFGSPLPSQYTGLVGGTQVCTFDQSLSTFLFGITVRFLPAGEGLLDHRIGLAVAILLCLVEGRQRSLVGDV